MSGLRVRPRTRGNVREVTPSGYSPRYPSTASGKFSGHTSTVRMYRDPRTVSKNVQRSKNSAVRLHSIGRDYTTHSFLSGEVVIGPNRLWLITSFKAKAADVASSASLASQTLSVPYRRSLSVLMRRAEHTESDRRCGMERVWLGRLLLSIRTVLELPRRWSFWLQRIVAKKNV